MSVTPYSDADLNTVISTDPGGLGCSPTLGDQPNADKLNATSASYTAYGAVPISKLLQWAGSPSAGVSGNNTPLQAINSFINTAGGDARMIGICQAAVQIFSAGTPLDLTDPNNYNPTWTATNGQTPGLVQILAGANNWGTGGVGIAVISSGQLSSLVSLGSQNPASYAAQRWGMGKTISALDVRRAFGRAA